MYDFRYYKTFSIPYVYNTAYFHRKAEKDSAKKNIFFMQNWFLGQFLFCAKDFYGHKIFFSYKNNFFPRKIIFSTKNDFCPPKYIFRLKIIFSQKNFFSPKNYFFEPKMTFSAKKYFSSENDFFLSKIILQPVLNKIDFY